MRVAHEVRKQLWAKGQVQKQQKLFFVTSYSPVHFGKVPLDNNMISPFPSLHQHCLSKKKWHRMHIFSLLVILAHMWMVVLLRLKDSPSGLPILRGDGSSGVRFMWMDSPSGVCFIRRDSPSGVRFIRRDSPSGVCFIWRDSPSGVCFIRRYSPSVACFIQRDSPSV